MNQKMTVTILIVIVVLYSALTSYGLICGDNRKSYKDIETCKQLKTLLDDGNESWLKSIVGEKLACEKQTEGNQPCNQ